MAGEVSGQGAGEPTGAIGSEPCASGAPRGRIAPWPAGQEIDRALVDSAPASRTLRRDEGASRVGRAVAAGVAGTRRADRSPGRGAAHPGPVAAAGRLARLAGPGAAPRGPRPRRRGRRARRALDRRDRATPHDRRRLRRPAAHTPAGGVGALRGGGRPRGGGPAHGFADARRAPRAAGAAPSTRSAASPSRATPGRRPRARPAAGVASPSCTCASPSRFVRSGKLDRAAESYRRGVGALRRARCGRGGRACAGAPRAGARHVVPRRRAHLRSRRGALRAPPQRAGPGRLRPGAGLGAARGDAASGRGRACRHALPAATLPRSRAGLRLASHDGGAAHPGGPGPRALRSGRARGARSRGDGQGLAHGIRHSRVADRRAPLGRRGRLGSRQADLPPRDRAQPVVGGRGVGALAARLGGLPGRALRRGHRAVREARQGRARPDRGAASALLDPART